MAWGLVLGVAAAVAALLVALAPRYGWHRDELYFLEAGKHLAWGYVDQPPFTPAVARVANAIAPGSVVVLRSLSAIATGVTTIIGALIVREMGGRRRACIAGALAMATSGFVLGVGHLLSTATFDLTAWMALLWLATRLLRTNDPRWCTGGRGPLPWVRPPPLLHELRAGREGRQRVRHPQRGAGHPDPRVPWPS